MTKTDSTEHEPILTSTLICPKCAAKESMTMPDNYCLWFHDCSSCGHKMRPLEGDCCVFCSYGDVPCPPIQLDNTCCSIPPKR